MNPWFRNNDQIKSKNRDTVGLNHAEYVVLDEYPRYRIYETGYILDMASERNNAWLSFKRRSVGLVNKSGRLVNVSRGKLVWRAFKGDPVEGGYRLTYKDGDSTNATLSNLAWKTLESDADDGSTGTSHAPVTNRFTHPDLVQHESGMWFKRSE